MRNKKMMYLVIALMLVGFAAVATTLYINGVAIIAGDNDEFDVYYSNAFINGVEDKTVITDDRNIDFNVTFKTVGETYVLDYDITNGSRNYDADVSINCSDGNDYVIVTNDWVDHTIIESTKTDTGTLTVEMIKGYTGESVLELPISCEIIAKATERDNLGVGTPADKVSNDSGMYDSEWNLIETWEDSGVNITKDYDDENYSTDSESMYVYLESHPEVVNVVVPRSVTRVGSYAFAADVNLTNVILPNTVTHIGSYAFAGCQNLTSFQIPSSVTSIEEYTFVGTGLKSITIPDNVETLENHVFSGIISLESVDIKEGVRSIGSYAFAGDISLANVTIPNSIQKIGENSFTSTAITSVVIPSGVETIENRAFAGCSNLSSVTITPGVKIIDEYAFAGTAITSIVIPSGVETIGKNAFSSCSNLSSVTINPDVKIIEEYAFAGTAITDLEVPSGVTSIGENAFYEIQHVTYHGSASGTPWGALSIN